MLPRIAFKFRSLLIHSTRPPLRCAPVREEPTAVAQMANCASDRRFGFPPSVRTADIAIAIYTWRSRGFTMRLHRFSAAAPVSSRCARGE